MLFICFLYLFVLPGGVAAQNIGLGFLALGMFYRGHRIGVAQYLFQLKSTLIKFRIPLFGAILFIVSGILGHFGNPESTSKIGGFVFTFGLFFFLPFVFAVAIIPQSRDSISIFDEKFKTWIRNFTCVTTFLWALICVSQIIWSWKLSGNSIVIDEPRGHGLYSHPLTLAYVCILLLPFYTADFLKNMRRWQSWVAVLSMWVIIWTSQSRSVQTVGFITSFGMMFIVFETKGRILLAIGSAIFVGVIFSTENSISDRFNMLIVEESSQESVQLEGTDQPESSFTESASFLPVHEDRVIFWQVHWKAFLDSPFFGYGPNQRTAFREKLYEKYGFAGFKKAYSAHNMFLQWLVDTGIVGFLGIFLWSIFWLFRVFSIPSFGFRLGFFASWLSLLIASITQNSIQDSEVRFIMMGSLTVYICYYKCLADYDQPVV